MSQLKLSGDASGTGIVTVAAPNTNSTYTVTLPAAAGTIVTGAAGSDTQVQFNDGGSTFGGDAGLTYNKTTDVLTVAGAFSAPAGTASAPSITATGDTNTGVFFPAADTVAITTGGTERMRITSSGLVNIGGGGNFGALNVRQATDVNIFTTVGGNDATAMKLSCINNAGGANIPLVLEGTYISFEKGGNSQSGRFDTNGYFLLGYTSSNGAYRLQVNSQIFATSATIATSDGRYKENVAPLAGALDIVKALNPVQFTWKQHPVHNFDRSCPTVGFIAQEVQQVLADKPYLNSIIKVNECTIQEEVKDEEGNVVTPAVKEDFYGIAEGNMIAILTKALQEAIGEIETLKTKVAALEAKGA